MAWFDDFCENRRHLRWSEPHIPTAPGAPRCCYIVADQDAGLVSSSQENDAAELLCIFGVRCLGIVRLAHAVSMSSNV